MADNFTELQHKIKTASTEKEKREAQNTLYEKIDNSCKPVIKRRLFDFSEEDREDVLAEVKEEVFKKEIELEGAVVTLCKNRCIDFIRKNKKRKKNTDCIDDEFIDIIDGKENSELTKLFSDDNFWKEFTEKLKKEKKDIVCSDIYRYKYCEELSHKEIAEKLNIKKSYVDDKLAKGKNENDNKVYEIFKAIIKKNVF